MSNLDSLQNATAQLPLQAAGARARNPSVTSETPGGNGSPQLLTPSGNALPPQAKPAAQSAIQRTEDIEAMVEQLADFAQSLQRGLSFSIDDVTGQTVIVVTDTNSDKVIRQIPSEEMVQLARKLQEIQEMQQQLSDSTGNLLEVKV